LWKNIETTSVCSIDSNVVVFFVWGRGVFWEGAVLRGRHKGFFGKVGGGNNVVCLKTRTLYLGAEMFMGGSGELHGGDIEVFSGGYIEVIFGGGG